MISPKMGVWTRFGFGLALVLASCERPPSAPPKAQNAILETPASSASQNLTLGQVLAHYGWADTKAQADLLALLHQAGIETESLDTPQEPEALLKTLLHLIQETQTKLRLRKEGQERWETSPVAWMEHNIEANQARLKRLGFSEAVLPASDSQGTIVLLGATRPRMASRLAFAQRLLQQGTLKANAIILLSGARPANPKVDGTLEELDALAKRQGKSANTLTEMDLLKDVYAQAPFFKDRQPILIDVPATQQDGRLIRPTTQSTVEALIDELAKHPEITRLYFVSNQPYIHYQEAVIRSVFLARHRPDIVLHVIGEGLSATQGSIQPLCEAMASYLWARLPSILCELNIRIPSALETEFKALYKDPSSRALIETQKVNPNH